MPINLNVYKFSIISLSAVLGLGIIISIINLEPIALGQSKISSISILKGASNPSTTEPYDPSPLTVSVGTTVIWTNNDGTGHTVTEGNPSGITPPNGFDSGILAPGKTFSHNFDMAGAIQYYCTLHPTMLGKILVK
jgi:plastocyanin